MNPPAARRARASEPRRPPHIISGEWKQRKQRKPSTRGLRTWAADQSVTVAIAQSSQQTSLSEVSALTNILQVCRAAKTTHNYEQNCSKETCSRKWVHLLPLLLFLPQDSLFNRHVSEYHVTTCHFDCS